MNSFNYSIHHKPQLAQFHRRLPPTARSWGSVPAQLIIAVPSPQYQHRLPASCAVLWQRCSLWPLTFEIWLCPCSLQPWCSIGTGIFPLLNIPLSHSLYSTRNKEQEAPGQKASGRCIAVAHSPASFLAWICDQGLKLVAQQELLRPWCAQHQHRLPAARAAQPRARSSSLLSKW